MRARAPERALSPINSSCVPSSKELTLGLPRLPFRPTRADLLIKIVTLLAELEG
jgi:hypothetical protein